MCINKSKCHINKYVTTTTILSYSMIHTHTHTHIHTHAHTQHTEPLLTITCVPFGMLYPSRTTSTPSCLNISVTGGNKRRVSLITIAMYSILCRLSNSTCVLLPCISSISCSNLRKWKQRCIQLSLNFWNVTPMTGETHSVASCMNFIIYVLY